MSWTTRDELAFIDGIGTWTNPDAMVTAATKVQILKSYRKGLLLRTRWTGLNQEDILAHTDKAIARFSALPSNDVLF